MAVSPKMAREFMKVGIAALIQELGFQTVDRMALETIIEMAISFLSELGRSTRAYTELARRTQPLAADVITAMVAMGIETKKFHLYGMRMNRPALRAPTYPVKKRVKVINPLRSGPYFIRPEYIPRNCPPFPPAHTWVTTPTIREPDSEYYIIREKFAAAKWAFRRALTNYQVRISRTQSVFTNFCIDYFPLLLTEGSPKPYLNALLPKDQVFTDEFKEDEEVPVDDLSEEDEDGKKVNPYTIPAQKCKEPIVLKITPKKKQKVTFIRKLYL